MIIAVTGFRGHRDGAFIRRALWATQEKFGVPLHVRVGDAMGADWFVLQWCEQNAVSHKVFRAQWEELGRSAGPERNERMLQGQGDTIRQGPTELVLGFPRTDGVKITVPGSGTWGCLIRAGNQGGDPALCPIRRTMSLMTRVKTVTGIIVVAVVAAVAIHVNPQAFKVTTGGDDDNYVLSVTWFPTALSHNTKIVVTVDGVPVITKNQRISPWGRTMVAAKGAPVVLIATSHLQALQSIDCMIMRNGKSVPGGGHARIPGPGTVTCTA